MTTRIYLEDPYLREFSAEVRQTGGDGVVLSCTCFHPGGGGQPHDRGVLLVRDQSLPVSSVREDDAGRVWHRVDADLPVGEVVRGTIDWPFRYALMRHHALMHVVNTIALRAYGGVITGAQLGPERSRIDFKIASLTREDLPAFERQVNDVLARDLALSSTFVSEAEYQQRPELRRTLNVQPPIVQGTVRVVEIAGFDVQACGGTHVHSTREIGTARIERFDNKGKDNKRLYWTLGA